MKKNTKISRLVHISACLVDAKKAFFLLPISIQSKRKKNAGISSHTLVKKSYFPVYELFKNLNTAARRDLWFERITVFFSSLVPEKQYPSPQR